MPPSWMGRVSSEQLVVAIAIACILYAVVMHIAGVPGPAYDGGPRR